MSELSQLDYEHLIKRVIEFNPNANLEIIKKAYEFIKKAHAGQKRESGEDYIQHSLRVAYVLAKLELNSVTIAAGLLHDVIEDTNTTAQKIRDEFGEEIAYLVRGVTKITKLKFESKEEKKAENLRKVLFATAKDIRVILIKLADRLHNMQTLRYCVPEKRERIATETLEIYVPIAHKLGIYLIKSELEDLCLRFLHPDIYTFIAAKVSEKKDEREQKIIELIELLKLKINEIEIPIYAIQGRAKSFHSIYNKMNKKNKSFEEIYDLLALRIITNSIENCYKILGLIHSNWVYIKSEFEDYIANPKPNGYQSIHTQIMLNKKPVEIQIRTLDMHRESEEGIAAHWRYKGTDRDKKFDRKISWLKQILEWKRNSTNAVDFIETLKIDLFKDEIYVITPKGEPIALPEGSTPVDFAYEIHTNLGNLCKQAKVNNLIRPLDYVLQSGDIVEIITQKKVKPSRQWLNFVKTNLAKSKIRQSLGLVIKEKKKDNFQHSKDLLDMVITDIDKKMVRISKCCNIENGTKIVGFKTKDNRVHIHNSDCPNVKELDQNKLINMQLTEQKEDLIKFNITVKDRIGIAMDILSAISTKGINIKSINMKEHRGNTIVSIKIDIAKLTPEQLNDLILEIKAIRDVVDLNQI